jgi:hypothetical protein
MRKLILAALAFVVVGCEAPTTTLQRETVAPIVNPLSLEVATCPSGEYMVLYSFNKQQYYCAQVPDKSQIVPNVTRESGY